MHLASRENASELFYIPIPILLWQGSNDVDTSRGLLIIIWIGSNFLTVLERIPDAVKSQAVQT
jgi:hypothetical protein